MPSSHGSELAWVVKDFSVYSPGSNKTMEFHADQIIQVPGPILEELQQKGYALPVMFCMNGIVKNLHRVTVT